MGGKTVDGHGSNEKNSKKDDSAKSH
ncbi:MAG: hypothetical protein ACD_75C01058G0002, partial [uncultured bacterium]